ncbi:MAG: adenylate/guanylate cyclase domain-containing protein [Williamsia sp.]|nr:adenylate/guanylate cyclase domain-containing protein [Williamsia sp.]
MLSSASWLKYSSKKEKILLSINSGQVDELHYCFKVFDGIIGKYGIEKIKTIGDAYLAVAGLPNTDPDHASKTVQAALEIREFIHDRKKQMGSRSFDIRIDIHSGSVAVSIVRVKKFAYDIWGDTVNTAARMEQHSLPGQINISEKTYELVKEAFAFTYRGEIEAKNKGLLKMYFVEKHMAAMAPILS